MDALFKPFEKWMQGTLDTGARDANGDKLYQFDEVLCDYDGEPEKLLIIWSPVVNEFIGQSEEGHWLPYESLHLCKKVAGHEPDNGTEQITIDI